MRNFLTFRIIDFECGSKIVLSSEHNGFEWLTYDEAITRLTWDSNGSKIVLSSEHNGFEWLTYDEAITRLTWDSNKTALYELNCRLLEACQIGGLEGKPC